jgi:hypothetical protein
VSSNIGTVRPGIFAVVEVVECGGGMIFAVVECGGGMIFAVVECGGGRWWS